MTGYKDEFTDLLGVYALDAVEQDERERIEDHLRSCSWCAAEVADYREVASFLAHTGTDAPAGVWDRIAAELSPPAPPLRMTFSPTGEVDPLAADIPTDDGERTEISKPGTVHGLPAATRTIGVRTFGAVLAIAACLLVVVGVFAWNLAPQRGTDGGDFASELQVTLVGDSAMEAVAMVDATGQGRLVAPGLPNPTDGDLYQLWGQVDGVVFSLGTFSGDTDVVRFQVDPQHLQGVEGFMVTEEQAPGVSVSTQEPVMAGEVT